MFLKIRPLAVAHHGLGQRDGAFGRDHRIVAGRHHRVNTKQRWLADGNVHVGRLVIDGGLEDVVKVAHGYPFSVTLRISSTVVRPFMTFAKPSSRRLTRPRSRQSFRNCVTSGFRVHMSRRLSSMT